jgi:hypothetical protein
MGKGGEKSVAPAEGVLEVLIDGRFYDVSKMKHPGGSVIKFYAGKGIDATQAFDNFHIRSKKAKKILDHLPSRVADKKETEQNLLPGQASLLEDFNQLTRDCKYRDRNLHSKHLYLNVKVFSRSVTRSRQNSTHDIFSYDLYQTQNKVENEGFFKPSASHTMMRLTEIVVLHAIGFYLLFNGRVGAGLGDTTETEHL